MNLVDAVEAAVGAPVEAWPTSDLIILFAFDPTMPFALNNLQKICAFLYGNNVPCCLSCQFFAACSYHPLHLVIQQFSYLYYLWSQYPPSPFRCQYYDLDAGLFKYTDWTYMTAFADVVPDFGYERTGFPTLARSILIQANQLEYVEDSV